MSSEPPRDPKDHPNAKKLHLVGRPLDQPSPDQKPADDGSKPQLSSDDFQRNFPEAGGASLAEAVKSIKPEDFLEVHKSACGRQGLMTGIVAGAVVGGLRFVWRGAPLKAANWAVGGFVVGATAGFERCHYLRRLERISMKRIVEVHQSEVAEKKRRKEAEEEEARKRAAEAAARPWYKFW
ncbi:hypothetical protein VUR80DRAFT_1337 [Thermomyces stellatus]